MNLENNTINLTHITNTLKLKKVILYDLTLIAVADYDKLNDASFKSTLSDLWDNVNEDFSGTILLVHSTDEDTYSKEDAMVKRAYSFGKILYDGLAS